MDAHVPPHPGTCGVRIHIKMVNMPILEFKKNPETVGWRELSSELSGQPDIAEHECSHPTHRPARMACHAGRESGDDEGEIDKEIDEDELLGALEESDGAAEGRVECAIDEDELLEALEESDGEGEQHGASVGARDGRQEGLTQYECRQCEGGGEARERAKAALHLPPCASSLFACLESDCRTRTTSR